MYDFTNQSYGQWRYSVNNNLQSTLSNQKIYYLYISTLLEIFWRKKNLGIEEQCVKQWIMLKFIVFETKKEHVVFPNIVGQWVYHVRQISLIRLVSQWVVQSWRINHCETLIFNVSPLGGQSICVSCNTTNSNQTSLISRDVILCFERTWQVRIEIMSYDETGKSAFVL